MYSYLIVGAALCYLHSGINLKQWFSPINYRNFAPLRCFNKLSCGAPPEVVCETVKYVRLDFSSWDTCSVIPSSPRLLLVIVELEFLFFRVEIRIEVGVHPSDTEVECVCVMLAFQAVNIFRISVLKCIFARDGFCIECSISVYGYGGCDVWADPEPTIIERSSVEVVARFAIFLRRNLLRVEVFTQDCWNLGFILQF